MALSDNDKLENTVKFGPFAPQERPNALVNVKFGCQEYSIGSFFVPNLAFVGE